MWSFDVLKHQTFHSLHYITILLWMSDLRSCLTHSWRTLYTFTALKKKKKITAIVSSVPRQMSHFLPCVRWMWLKLAVAGQLARSGLCQGRSNSQSSSESGCSSSTLQEMNYYNRNFLPQLSAVLPCYRQHVVGSCSSLGTVLQRDKLVVVFGLCLMVGTTFLDLEWHKLALWFGSFR